MSPELRRNFKDTLHLKKPGRVLAPPLGLTRDAVTWASLEPHPIMRRALPAPLFLPQKARELT